MPKYSIRLDGLGSYEISSQHDLSQDEINAYIERIKAHETGAAIGGPVGAAIRYGVASGAPIPHAPARSQPEPSPMDALLQALDPRPAIQGFIHPEPMTRVAGRAPGYTGPMDGNAPSPFQVTDPYKALDVADQVAGYTGQKIGEALMPDADSSALHAFLPKDTANQIYRGVRNTVGSLVNPIGQVTFFGNAATRPGQTIDEANKMVRKAEPGWLPSGTPAQEALPDWLGALKGPVQSENLEDYTGSLLGTAALGLGVKHGISRVAESPLGDFIRGRGNANAGRAARALQTAMESGISEAPATHQAPQPRPFRFGMNSGSPDLDVSRYNRSTPQGAPVRSGYQAPVLLGEQAPPETPGVLSSRPQPQPIDVLREFQLRNGEPLVRHAADLSRLEAMQEEFGAAEGMRRFVADRETSRPAWGATPPAEPVPSPEEPRQPLIRGQEGERAKVMDDLSRLRAMREEFGPEEGLRRFLDEVRSRDPQGEEEYIDIPREDPAEGPMVQPPVQGRLAASLPPDSNAPVDTSVLRYIDPMDSRLDPFDDDYNPSLVHATYQELFGRAPEVDEFNDLLPEEHTRMIDGLYREMQTNEPADTSHVEEWLPTLKKFSRGGGEEWIRMFKRRGKWYVDGRSRTVAVALDGLPEDIKQAVLDHILSEGDPEVRYVTEHDYQAWKREGLKRPPNSRHLSEMILREQGTDFGDGVHKNTFVPRSYLVSYIKSLEARIGENAAKADRAAQGLGLSNEELKDVIQYIQEQSRADGGQVAEGGPNAELEAALGGNASGGERAGSRYDASDVLTPDQAALLNAPAEDLELTAPESAPSRSAPTTQPGQASLGLNEEVDGQRGFDMNRPPIQASPPPPVVPPRPAPQPTPVPVTTAPPVQVPPLASGAQVTGWDLARAGDLSDAPVLSGHASLTQRVMNAIGLGRLHEQASTIFNPEGMTDRSGYVARTLREGMGTATMMKQAAYRALDEGERTLGAIPASERMAFADRYEKGQMQPTPEMERAADAMRTINARNVAELQSEGLLENAITNYLPHLFKDVDGARKAIGEYAQRTLKPNSDFLKHRNHDFLADAVQAAQKRGLALVTDNPVEAMRLRTNSILDYIAMRRSMRALLPGKGGQDVGIRYVRVGGEIPKGYIPLADKAWSVIGPGEVVIREAYDGPMRDALIRLADNLGIDHEHIMKIKGHPDALGGSLRGQAQIQTTWGSPETVLTHELGHAIDDKFGMARRLFQGDKGKIIRSELQRLAEFRYEGITPDQSYIDYVRSPAEMVANLFHAYVHAPELAAKVAPEAVARLNRLVDARPELHPLRDVQPSLRIDVEHHTVRMPGMQVLGRYYAPPDVAAVLNNWANPGWDRSPFYRAGMGVNRAFNSIQMAGASVHGIGSLVRQSALDLSLGMQELLSRGYSPGDRLRGLGRIAASPVGGVTATIQGGKLIKAFRSDPSIASYLSAISDPKTAAAIEGIRVANGRIVPDEVYVKDAVRTFQDAVRSQDWPAAAKHVPEALLELASMPIMRGLVPRLKLATFMNHLWSDMQRTGIQPGTDAFRDLAVKAWDHTDNVLGQVVYDNLFAKRWTKNIAMLSTRSASWNGGSIRDAINAVQDAPKIAQGHFSYRTAYPVALTGMTMLYGGLLHYLFTGEPPQTKEDLTYPKTGRKNPDGSDERISIPTDFKDYIHYAHDPVGTLLNKQSPLLGYWPQLWNNQAFGGVEIANPDDPLWKRAMDKAAYLAGSLEPFGVSTVKRQANDGKDFSVLPFLGLNPAPSFVTRSEALNKAAEYARLERPPGTRTQEEANRSMARSAVLGMIRNGEMDKAVKFIKEKELTPHDLDLISDRIQSPALALQVKSLSPAHAIHVYELATPEEKAMIYPLIVQKIQRAATNDPADGQQLMLSFASANQR